MGDIVTDDCAVLRYLAALVHGTLAADASGEPATCVRTGSADVHLTLVPDSPPVLHASSLILRDVPPSPALFEALNHISRSSPFVRVFHHDGAVHAEGDLLLDILSDVAITNLVTAVSEVADFYDDQLKERFGGMRGIDDPDGCPLCVSTAAGPLTAVVPQQSAAPAQVRA